MIPITKEVVLIISVLLQVTSGIDGSEWESPPSIPPDSGGITYPERESATPSADFDCQGRMEGHYGDQIYDCVVFHYCSKSGKKYSYKCKEGKKFDSVSNSCVPFLRQECGFSSKQNGDIVEDLRRREGKFSFPNFPSESMKRNIEKSLIPSEGLGALAAFASLAHIDHGARFNSFQNTSTKRSDNSDDRIISDYNKKPPKYDAHNYSQSKLNFQNPSLKPVNQESKYSYAPIYQQSQDSVQEDSVDRFIQDSDTEYYEDIDSDLKEAPNQLPYQTNSFSFFPPPAHVQNAFNSVRDTANAPAFTFVNSQVRQNQRGNVIEGVKNLPVSHVHFTPPGFRSSQHSVSPIRNTNGNLPTYVSTVAPRKPEPPSVFGAPTPRSFSSSTSSLKDIYRSGYEKEQFNTPQYYDYYNGYKPVSTPAYYDDINYDIPGYYNNPGDFSNPNYNSQIHSHNLNINVERYQPIVPKISPQSPLSTPLRGQQPLSFIKHPNYVHSTIKSNIGDDEKSYHELSKVFPGNNFINTPLPQSHFVTKNPIIRKTTNSPLGQPGSFVGPTHILQDSVIEEPIQNYPTVSPPSHVNLGLHRPLKQQSNFVHEKENEITTYSPKQLPKLIENVVEVEEELEEKPKKRIASSRLPSARKRPGRRPTPSAKIRASTVPEKVEPTVIEVEEKESYEELVEDADAYVDPPEINAINQPATQIPATTPQPKSTLPTKPTRQSLKGSLKDRLNRLGTRRRTLNQSTQRQATPIDTSNDGIKESVNTSKPVRKIPLKRPVSRNEVQIEKPDEISPSDEKKLKGRITNYFKEGSTSRNKNSPRRPGLKRRNGNEKENDDVEKKVSLDSINEKESISATDDVMSPSDVVSVNSEENKSNSDMPFDTLVDVGEVLNDDSKTGDVPATAVSESYGEVAEEEDHKMAESPKDLKASRKRTMNPDVRARFKEFLKNRKNGSNNRKRLRPQGRNGEIDTEKDENEEKKTKSSSSNDDETDNTVNESEIFEESVPLLREEKVVPLTSEPESNIKNEISIKNKGNYNLQDNLSNSGVISSKPLRYELSKSDKLAVTDAAENFKPVTRVVSYSDNKYVRRKFPTKVAKLAQPSITTHTVVRPDFKQIVKMSPRHPELIPPIPSKVYENKSTVKKDEVITQSDVMLDIEENLENDAESKITKMYSSGLESHNLGKIISKEDPYDDKQSDNFEHTVFDSIKEETEDFSHSYNQPITPTLPEHKERTKPVFNLDILSNLHKDASEDSHIYDIDSKFQTGQTSAINFEPFPLESDIPVLPIELLLRAK